MKEDKILEMFFENERWQYAIEKGVGKDIRKEVLAHLTRPDLRAKIYVAIRDGKYEISPPHTALIPKDTPGEFRTVYVNEPMDRVILSIANDLLFDIMPEKVHRNCASYQRGVGFGSVVKDVSRIVYDSDTEIIGFKSDLSKYFDSVPIEYIDRAFDDIEEKHGHSALIDVLRKYYHSNWYFDTDGFVCEKYQSLKQGCSVASYLADVILYHIDERISNMDVFYKRYSDDIICLGADYEKAMEALKEELGKMNMLLNPKKVEYLSKKRWFKFLGFEILGDKITLSKKWIKHFQHEIEQATTKKRNVTYKGALNAVNKYLYVGNGKFSWATQVLTVVNVRRDIDELNKYVMDSLRAVRTGKKGIGGLGFRDTDKRGCIVRGPGCNVTTNRLKYPKLEGYYTIGCMQDNINTCREVYNAIVAQL